MKKYVDIEITGSHMRVHDNEPIAVSISGHHYADGDVHKIDYVEEAPGFDDVIINTIIVERDRVEIIKEGAVNSGMIFANNGRFKTFYETPFGTLDMETETRLLLVDLQDEEINVYIEYRLYIDGHSASESRLRIHVAEAVNKVG